MQNGNIITYVSRQLKPREKNYAMHDLKLLSVVFALKVWRRYLLQSLSYLRMISH